MHALSPPHFLSTSENEGTRADGAGTVVNISRAEELMLNRARVELGGGYLDGQREGAAVLDKAPITSLGKQSGAAHQLLYVETPSAPARC